MRINQPTFGNIYQLSPQKEQAYQDLMLDVSDERDEKFARFLDGSTGETDVLTNGFMGLQNNTGSFYLLTQGGPVQDVDKFRAYNSQHNLTKTVAENLTAYVQANQHRIQYIG